MAMNSPRIYLDLGIVPLALNYICLFDNKSMWHDVRKTMQGQWTLVDCEMSGDDLSTRWLY